MKTCLTILEWNLHKPKAKQQQYKGLDDLTQSELMDLQ